MATVGIKELSIVLKTFSCQYFSMGGGVA